MISPSAPVLVTGGTGGIGVACIEKLRDTGSTVVSWDLPDMDITDPAAVADALAQIGPISALIHCAGVLEADTALDPTAIAKNFAVNFHGATNVCTQVAQAMCNQGSGSIVVVSSNAAVTPRIGMASYGASKAAITAWTKTLGLECAPYGVRCNIVSPGSTDTTMLRGMWPTGEDHTENVINGSIQQFRLGIPLQKIATPADIADACLFLISPAAGHITMHDLRVDGGATLDQ